MKKMRSKVYLNALVFVLLLTSASAEVKKAVRTENGLVSGTPGRDATITVFEGIPYAQPPVGDLRWLAPRPPHQWSGVLKADHFSDGCAQNFPKADFPRSEDCLYLNIWTPAKLGNEGLPVMVWIHGGGLRVGSAREALYNGEEIARKGVVVVSLNYRLGIFGFFAHPELTKESPHHASGNYGLLDQVAALAWVHRNIAAFGGDPNKVTIFGQSSGGFSVIALVASPLAKGLFRAAIAESGGARMGLAGTESTTLAQSEQAGVKLAESLGAHSLAELRSIPAEKLLQVNPAPNVDGWFFPESAAAIFNEGKENKVPMILGSNSDEAQHMIRSAVPASEFRDRAEKDFDGEADRYLSLYPADSDQAAKVSQQRQMSDRTALAQRSLAKDISRSGNKVYLYYFDYLDTGGYNAEVPTLGLTLGADHGAELPYVFGLLNHWKAPVPDRDLSVEKIVMAYWTNFAKTLDPNGTGLPQWKPFSSVSSEVMVLDQEAKMKGHPREAQIDFLQAHQKN
jgi:para-nitrobenzyl esterase